MLVYQRVIPCAWSDPEIRNRGFPAILVTTKGWKAAIKPSEQPVGILYITGTTLLLSWPYIYIQLYTIILYIYMYVYLYIYIYINILYICIYIYICIYTYESYMCVYHRYHPQARPSPFSQRRGCDDVRHVKVKLRWGLWHLRALVMPMPWWCRGCLQVMVI